MHVDNLQILEYFKCLLRNLRAPVKISSENCHALMKPYTCVGDNVQNYFLRHLNFAHDLKDHFSWHEFLAIFRFHSQNHKISNCENFFDSNYILNIVHYFLMVLKLV